MKKQIDNKYNEINIIELLNNSLYDSAKILAPIDNGTDTRYLNIYNKSGVSLLLDVCLSELKNAVHCCWVDYSCMATTMISKYNYGFEASALNSEYSDSNIIKNINTNLNQCISLLNSEYRNVYFHPEFLNGNHIAYISSIDAVGNDKMNYEESSFDYNKYNPEFSFCSGLTRLEQNNKEVQSQIDTTRKSIENDKLSVNEFVEYMHKNYRETFLCSEEQSRLSSFYICLPCIAPSHSSDSIFSSQTACFIFITVTDKHKEFVKNILAKSSIYTLLHSVLSVISVNLPFVAAINLKDVNIKESIKSAKAAIMSRNMSHNLGSHVMAYLKQKLNSVADILKEENDVIKGLPDLDLTTLEVSEITKLQDIITNVKDDVQLPFLVGLGKFLGYLQERQDYIATIATDYIPYGAPINLKDAIYDELNPDLRFERHGADKPSNNKPSNILLSYIAKSENLSRENRGNGRDIKLGFVNYDKESGKSITWGDNSSDSAMDSMRAYNLSLPGGLVGRQAIFSILENIIRNAAKHDNISAYDDLKFVIDIIDGSEFKGTNMPESIDERICDANLREAYAVSKGIEDMYLLTITNNAIIDEQVVLYLKEALKDDYIDDSNGGQLKGSNKGIKEIRISAAWIRFEKEENKYVDIYFDKDNNGKTISANYIADPTKLPPLVGVEITKENTLRYIIAVRKNKEFALIKEGFVFDETTNIESLERDNNWTIFESAESFCNTSEKSFGFIIISNDSAYKRIRSVSSNRIVTMSAEELTSTQDCDEIKKLVYHKYANSYLTADESTDPSIYVWDKNNRANDVIDKRIKYYTDSEVGQDEAKYVYRNHHATDKEFLGYKRALSNGAYKFIQFIEGITGDNSTDRLVRRETLDSRWYYTHLVAMNKRVAIFDERLFRIVHDFDEVKLIRFSDKLNINFEESEDNWDSKYQQLIDDNQNHSKLIEIEDNCMFYEDFVEFKSTLDGSRMIEYRQSGNHKSMIYSQKGVDVFTIVEVDGVFYIVGYVGEYDNQYCYNMIATIGYDENGEVVVKFNDDYQNDDKHSFSNIYDYISIHQGLLDKLYETLKCKNDNAKKNKITASLQKHFNKNKDSKIGEFLPNFIIHSGRAKPTSYDMPQKQPFLQYAAIENAVKDCKYSLIELLDYARYE